MFLKVRCLRNASVTFELPTHWHDPLDGFITRFWFDMLIDIDPEDDPSASGLREVLTEAPHLVVT